MKRPTKVEALSGYRIRVVYPDGVESVIDLSADVGQIAWSEDIEICPDAAYREITHTTSTETAHA